MAERLLPALAVHGDPTQGLREMRGQNGHARQVKSLFADLVYTAGNDVVHERGDRV